jgi:molybdopterin molybdotransferase
MISIAEALDMVLASVRPLPEEEIALDESVGRVLAEDVVAGADVPAFANSQMDGYAVRAEDVAGGSESRPVELRVLGTIAAGRPLGVTVGRGEAARIMTGAPIPAGADAVIPVEETSSEAPERVSIASSATAGRFVRPAGEDLRAGDRVLEQGRRLGAPDIGLLASLGRASVHVRRRPRVAILGTGDELVPIGGTLGPGQIHDSNAHALGAAVRELGGEPSLLGIVRDDPAALRAALTAALRFDAVLSTGGVSVGDFDHVKDVMDEIGLERRFWRVAQKPGKPIVFAVRDRTLFFGLPGNPVSAMVCFHLYVAPALRAAAGLHDVFLPTGEVVVGEAIRTAKDLTELVRCTLRSEAKVLVAHTTGTQSSGALRSLSLADALLISPPGTAELRAGDPARALLLRGGPALASTHPFA